MLIFLHELVSGDLKNLYGSRLSPAQADARKNKLCQLKQIMPAKKSAVICM